MGPQWIGPPVSNGKKSGQPATKQAQGGVTESPLKLLLEEQRDSPGPPLPGAPIAF